jgi:SAM-dependent methyltransferase
MPAFHHPLPEPASDQAVRAIYRDEYADGYPSLYLDPWRRKHELNARNLAALLDRKGEQPLRWLDLACGQAWHFSRFPGRARMIGLDLSAAQLARARRNAPHASFIQGNMGEAGFAPASFDLVTNFWGGYCYLGSRDRIASLWRSAIDWIAPGGALYVEVLLGEDLASFNRSQFAQRTGFTVSPRSDDYSEWAYHDFGGTHAMTSPPLQQFLDIVSPAFRNVEARHDGMFMVHLIATDRRGPKTSSGRDVAAAQGQGSGLSNAGAEIC